MLATYWCALAFVSRRGAVLAALMMMSSAIVGVEARLAKTDAVLLFTVVIAMAVMARVYLAPRRGDPQPGLGQLAIFWTALALGILIKGPLILMVVGLAAVTLVIIDSLGALAVGVAAASRPVMAFAPRSTLVHRDLRACR